MDETIILPSPNWFQVSGVAVSKDGWIVYSGPSKSLCVLEPLPSNYNAVVQSTSGFKAHMVSRAHPEKIISIDISPEWPEKRSFLAGSADGSVKQWLVEYDDTTSLQIKTTHVHDVHKHDKEEIAGLGYSNETYAITVGVFGNIVKWDINSNVVKNYNHILKSFKPTSVSCSRHALLNVAVGTKQGVVFVIDLNAPGQILYKVRSHDEEITNLSWCPQFEVGVRKSLSTLTSRLEKIRNEPEPDQNEPELKPFAKNTSLKQDKASNSKKKTSVKPDETNDGKKTSVKPDETNDEKKNTSLKPDAANDSKTLNESEIVQEDDLFDMYKDHAADEFGHKKYEPEDIYVKVKTEEKENDFLAECSKLKDEILKKKNEPDATIESLVEALDKTHVASTSKEKVKEKNKNEKVEESSSLHIHRHLLASIGKHGGVKIYSKSGKLISSCTVPNNKNSKKPAGWTSLLWIKPGELLVADGKGELLEINPLKVDCKNKLEYRVIHSLHKRGLYGIASGAPKVFNTEGEWTVWTVGQDRQMIEYSLSDRKAVRTYMTCGGFVYNIAPCPYDASKMAVAVGDGAIRVWESEVSPDDESKLTAGQVTSFWQNVQGKVLTVAWHPTKENLLAFATAEARVGVIDTSGKTERPAKVLQPAAGPVYSLCWGGPRALYAAAGGELLRYNVDNTDDAPTHIPIRMEGAVWQISSVTWTERALVVGSTNGAVAILDQSLTVLAAAYPFTKIIHGTDWHPQQVSDSSEDSPYKNLIAVSSLDKNNEVAVLEVGEKEDGNIKLSVWKMISGHAGPVHTVAWSPHRDARLLTSSHDATVRIWNVLTGECLSIFGGHAGPTLGVAWSGQPGVGGVMSGGADCCLRLWKGTDHPAEAYTGSKTQTTTRRERRRKEKAIAIEKPEEADDAESDDQVAAKLDTKPKVSKKLILPKTYKKMISNSLTPCKKLLKKYLEKQGGSEGVKKEEDIGSDEKGAEDRISDYIRVFGSINEVNELLDEELLLHERYSNHEAYIILSILRGQIDQLFQYASQKDIICPFLLSIAPCVSFKYWKDATQLYLAQIDRLVAKDEHKKLEESKCYGGPVYRKVVALLSVHDVKGAVDVLTASNLYKEAYVLCRVRHMDSIAEEVLHGWAKHSLGANTLPLSAACYIVLGDLQRASFVLGKSDIEEHLHLAAELAKLSGQNTFADHIVEKSELIKSKQSTEEVLKDLPTRMELLMKQEAEK